MMCKTHDFTFQAGDETLVATIDHIGDTVPQPAILNLHGGGPGGRQRIEWLSLGLLTPHGHAVLRFNHSGVPDSTGDSKQASMRKRRDEALAAAQFLKSDVSYTIIGTSMGAPNAVALLPYLNVKNLILICPAAYAAASFDVPFGDGFTDIIRTPYSYRDSETFRILESFTGSLLVIAAGNDDIIPDEVIELYKKHSTNCSSREFLTLPDAPHVLYQWLPNHPVQQDFVFDKVLRLLAETNSL